MSHGGERDGCQDDLPCGERRTVLQSKSTSLNYQPPLLNCLLRRRDIFTVVHGNKRRETASVAVVHSSDQVATYLSGAWCSGAWEEDPGIDEKAMTPFAAGPMFGSNQCLTTGCGRPDGRNSQLPKPDWGTDNGTDYTFLALFPLCGIKSAWDLEAGPSPGASSGASQAQTLS